MTPSTPARLSLLTLALVACSPAIDEASPGLDQEVDAEPSAETEDDTETRTLRYPEPPVCYEITEDTRATVRDAEPVEAFEIMDGLYYVGNTQVSVHLLTSDDGLILFDSAMPHEVGWLVESIAELGFDPRDVSLVIASHDGIDHVGGHRYFQHHFGAETWVGEGDVETVANGTCVDGVLGEVGFANYPRFRTDRVIRDGDVLEWGGRTITAWSVPAASPGALAFAIELTDDDGTERLAGMIGGTAPRGDLDVYGPALEALKEVPITVFLAVHPSQNDTFERAARLGETPNPFVDPDAWQGLIDEMLRGRR